MASANPTPIRTLIDMRYAADVRSEAVETASDAEERTHADESVSLRIWSRQTLALAAAVMAEPPTNIADVLSVLCCLAEARDLHDDADNPSERDVRDINETTDAALHNCIVALAGNLVPDRDYTPTEQATIDWSARRVKRWLPDTVAEGER